uniref:Germinal-center associated nuclear protein (inferred by orthology to a human protein) n=1 Tax=Anisakis simplex TaxID=6269 RepID=A0A0M3K3H9_ANISI
LKLRQAVGGSADSPSKRISDTGGMLRPRPLRSVAIRRPATTLTHPPATHIPRRKPASFRDLDKPTTSTLRRSSALDSSFCCKFEIICLDSLFCIITAIYLRLVMIINKPSGPRKLLSGIQHRAALRNQPSSSSGTTSSPLLSRRQSVNRAALVARKRNSGGSTSSTSPSASKASSTAATAAASTSRVSSPKTEILKRLNTSRVGTLRSGVDNRYLNIMKVNVNSLFMNEKKIKGNSEKSENEKQLVGGAMAKKTVSNSVNTSAVTKSSVASTSKGTLSKAEVARQLKRLMDRVCEDDYAKYQVLDERDKIMCRGRVKSADVENAIVTQGTCADMCPEKERYQRVVQKRLSVYECDENGVMLPELTVKDYSRSAADQEEPLSHELRPSDVLERTMNYLLSRVAENIPTKDEELAQWYDFLWNRTRAIRKDLTQQMLINNTAVKLIEQCVRFHIFVSHRLCELGLNEFDQRMNTENLTKSLQSLRYLYGDLAKRGSRCPSEAEFRAYDVLLNLSDSNILREVLTYRRDIRESPEVRLALRLFSSFQSGNYVRFFRMLKEKGTYLQCCICHRYFDNVRTKALYVLTSSSHESHRLGNMVLRSTTTNRYPLVKLAELLGFDDITQASTTLGLHGVYLDGDNNEQNVILSKTNFYFPDEPIPPRIHAWIEAKRGTAAVSEVLSGGERLSVELPRAIVSFDQSGAYIYDPVLNAYLMDAQSEAIIKSEADEMSASAAAKSAFPPEDRPRMELPKPVNDLKPFSAPSFEMPSVLKTEPRLMVDNRKIGSENASLSPFSGKIPLTLPSDTFSSATFRPRCQEVLMSLKILHRHKQAQKANENRKKMIRDVMDEILMRLTDEVIIAVADKGARKAMRLAHHDRFLNVIRETSTKVSENILGEVINTELNALCALSMKENVYDVKSRLHQIAQNLDRFVNKLLSLYCCCCWIAIECFRLWLKQFFDTWRNSVKIKRERERKQYEILAAFPSVPPGDIIQYISAYSMLRIKGHNLLEKRSIPQDFSSILIEQKVNRIQEKRRERIVKQAFDHWKQWTELRICRNKFAKEFSMQPSTMIQFRKRSWKQISRNSPSDPFGFREVLQNQMEMERRKFGPRLSDLEPMKESESNFPSSSVAPYLRTPLVTSTPMDNNSFIQPKLNGNHIWVKELSCIAMTPLNRLSSSQRSFLSRTQTSHLRPSRRSLPDYSSIMPQTDSDVKPNPLKEISKQVDDFLQELEKVSSKIVKSYHQSKEILNESA